jgi:hypothetical protein
MDHHHAQTAMVQAGPYSGAGMTETMTTAGHGMAAFLIAHS